MSDRDGNLRQLFREHLPPQYHWTTVETGGVTRGVPDSNYCVAGIEGWVEYKKTKGWAVGLSSPQTAWISRRVRAGGRVTVAVRRRCEAGPRRAAADELWLFDGEYAAELRRHGLKSRGLMEARPDLELGIPYISIMHGGPAGWGWASVDAALRRGL